MHHARDGAYAGRVFIVIVEISLLCCYLALAILSARDAIQTSPQRPDGNEVIEVSATTHAFGKEGFRRYAGVPIR